MRAARQAEAQAAIAALPTGSQPRLLAAAPARRRYELVDFARGLAVALMILSHGVKGLLGFDQFTDWGLVPVHLVTKFSSSLFILVFGASLAVAHVPAAGTPAWPVKRGKLLLRGLKILFWYKALTIVEMGFVYSRREVLDALMYRAFPVYVEILGYYALALLWIPFALPAWKRIPQWAKVLSVPASVALASVASARWGFGGHEGLRALMVEDDRFYTWGQLTRLPLVLTGLVIGGAIPWAARARFNRLVLSGGIAVAACILFALFAWRESPGLVDAFAHIARNEGKHPPEAGFMLFSLSGAFAALSLSVLGGERLARWLRPVTWLGKDALQSFVFHISALFVFYRYLFGFWHGVSYGRALSLTLILIGLTAVWVKVVRWIQEKS